MATVLHKGRSLLLGALVGSIGLVSLAACGGETPTATPVAIATATTAAMVDATATTGGSTVDATATTGGSMTDATPTTGGGGTGGDMGDALSLLKSSGETMKGLKSYHMVMKIESAGASVSAEGDTEPPDKKRLTMDTGGMKTEIIIIGGNAYSKVPGTDQYIASPVDPSLLNASNTTSIGELAENPTVVGEEQINGVTTTHVTFSYDANKAMETTGVAATPGTDLGRATADVWIEKSTGYIHQYKVVSEAAGASSTTTITYSKFNEPISPPIEKPSNIMDPGNMIPTVPVP